VSVQDVKMLSFGDIAMIKVFRSLFAATGGREAVAIYTRKGDGGFSKGLPQGRIVGYELRQPALEYDYSDDLFSNIKHDTREVLLWKSTVPVSEKEGRYRLRFYNSDEAKVFNVVVMGFTKEGQPVYVEQRVAANGSR